MRLVQGSGDLDERERQGQLGSVAEDRPRERGGSRADLTHLLGAHEVPPVDTGLETVHSPGAPGVGLGPSGPEGAQRVGILGLVAQEVADSPFVELDGVDVGRLLVLVELVDGGEHATPLGGAVELRLGTELDGLAGRASWMVSGELGCASGRGARRTS